MKPIEFNDYDKLTDTVYELGQKTVLELVVSLSRKNEATLDRYHYHKEFRYPSKYTEDKMISIKRSFDYYLILRKIDIRDSDIMIRTQDMYLVIGRFEEALEWFKSGTFGMKKSKELYVKISRPSILIPGLAAGKYIQLDPIVITYENTGTQVQGIRLTLGDESIFVDISIDRFYGFVYVIKNMNLFGSAQNLVNYLGRPDYGTNLREYDTSSFLEPQEEKDNMMSGAKTNRTILNNSRPKSFFDKIDNIT